MNYRFLWALVFCFSLILSCDSSKDPDIITAKNCRELSAEKCTSDAIPGKKCRWNQVQGLCEDDEGTTTGSEKNQCTDLDATACADSKKRIDKDCDLTPTGFCVDTIAEALKTRMHCSQLIAAGECARSNALIDKACVTSPNEPKCREATATLPTVALKDQTPPPPLQSVIPQEAGRAGWVRHASSVSTDQEVEAETKTSGQGPNKIPKVMAWAEKTITGKLRKITVVYGDIVKETTKGAITNAANPSLEGGGGVDRAVHNAAGKKLKDEGAAYRELFTPGGFMVGSAMASFPYNMYDAVAKNITLIVQTVAPGGNTNVHKEYQSYSAFYNSMLKASEYKVKIISIPSLGTGIFNFPMKVATELFFRAALQFFIDHPDTTLEEIRITNFDEPTVKAYVNKFNTIFE